MRWNLIESSLKIHPHDWVIMCLFPPVLNWLKFGNIFLLIQDLSESLNIGQDILDWHMSTNPLPKIINTRFMFWLVSLVMRGMTLAWLYLFFCCIRAGRGRVMEIMMLIVMHLILCSIICIRKIKLAYNSWEISCKKVFVFLLRLWILALLFCYDNNRVKDIY